MPEEVSKAKDNEKVAAVEAALNEAKLREKKS